MQTLLTGADGTGIPLRLVTDAGCAQVLEALPAAQSAWARAQGFAAERHRLLLLPDAAGAVAGALLGLGAARSTDEVSVWDAALLSERLPAGTYRLATDVSAHAATQFALGWQLGSYRLARYRSAPGKKPDRQCAHCSAWCRSSLCPRSSAGDGLGTRSHQRTRQSNGTRGTRCRTRWKAGRRAHDGESSVHMGETLASEYPLVAAVGAGSARAPRLIDCRRRFAARERRA